MAKIIELIPGRDGQIHTVRLKTQHGTVLRPVQRAYSLEIRADENCVKEEVAREGFRVFELFWCGAGRFGLVVKVFDLDLFVMPSTIKDCIGERCTLNLESSNVLLVWWLRGVPARVSEIPSPNALM
ncbi:hypothetical protein TNCV_684841 [Trichonephila clavipes]|nr:hypothetical protein TNCV_684841 [Trichonephila clavipes]